MCPALEIGPDFSAPARLVDQPRTEEVGTYSLFRNVFMDRVFSDFFSRLHEVPSQYECTVRYLRLQIKSLRRKDSAQINAGLPDPIIFHY